MPISYFHTWVDEKDYTHSIDKVSISFDFGRGNNCLKKIVEEFNKLSEKFGLIPDVKLDLPPRSSFAWAIHYYKFRYGLVTFLGGQIRQGDKYVYYYNGRVEFNPNKQLVEDDLTIKVCQILLKYAKTCLLKRLDYAIDVPFTPENVVVLQSLKRKQLIKGTRYFGSPGSHGRLKIYDKQKESILDYPLTRIEYTLIYNHKIRWDDIMVLNEKKEDLDFELTSNTRVLVRLCMALRASGYDYLEMIKDLNARKRKEVILAVEGYGQKISCDEDILNYLVGYLMEYLGLPFEDAKMVEIDEDGFIRVSDELLSSIPF